MRGAFDRLRGMSFEDMLAQVGLLEWYEFQRDRAMYEYFYNEPYNDGVIRQFRKVLGVIGWVSSFCPYCQPPSQWAHTGRCWWMDALPNH